MTRKLSFLTLTLLLSLLLVSQSAESTTVRAAAPTPAATSDFPVSVQLSGVIAAISKSQLTLTDGTVVTLNKQTQSDGKPLKVGQTVTIVAEVGEDDGLVALSIQQGTPADDTSTAAATAAPTKNAPGDSGKGKGKDQGQNQENSDNNANDNGNGNGNSNGNGHGNGKGKGNGSGSANGNGKGNDQGDSSNVGNGDDQGQNQDSSDNTDNGGNGKGNGKGNNDKATNPNDVAACLANTTQPVATRLSKDFDVSYSEIMTWHCQGFGFGEIARAYVLAQNSKLTVEEIFAERKAGKGWGQIFADEGLKVGDLSGNPIGKGKKNKGSD